MVKLYDLIQTPFRFDTNDLEGELYIKGNILENTLLLIVQFSSNNEIVPLKVKITSEGKDYNYVLCIVDEFRKIVQSTLTESDFPLSKGFCIKEISPLAKICIED